MIHQHTSELLEEVVAKAPDGPADLEWLLGHLDRKSFGLLLLLLGLLVIVPGVASVATLMLIFPSVELMLGHSRPTFPRLLGRRAFDFKRFKRFTQWVLPALRAIERLSRPRWMVPQPVLDRLVGAVVLLLSLTALWPLPLVNVVPGMAIVLVAVAYLQRDGLLLMFATALAVLFLLAFGWTVWASATAMMNWFGL